MSRSKSVLRRHTGPTKRAWFRVIPAALVPLLMVTACEAPDRPPEMPVAEQAAARYSSNAEAEVRGNLLEVRVAFSEDMRRGGRLWARGGPYFYLFSGATEELFAEYPDMAAVRVVTRTQADEEVARATLVRGTLSEYDWRRARNLAARAQTEGTERPSLVQELANYGDDHTEHELNTDLLPR